MSPDWIPYRRFTVGEYYRLAEFGLLSRGAYVELIEGEIVDREQEVTRHAGLREEVDDSFLRHQFTVVEHRRMVDLGLFYPAAPTELIDGQIVELESVGTRLGTVVTRIGRRLSQAAPGRASVRVYRSLQLDDFCEPQPHIVLLGPSQGVDVDSQEARRNVLLIVEVSKTRLRYNREIKVPLYARRGVPETWIVDVTQEEIRSFRIPEAGAYRATLATRGPASITLAAIPGSTVDLSDIFV